MTTAYYEQLALGWAPESKSDRQFKLITAIAVVVMLSIGVVFSSINVPKEERQAHTVIPERIANFVVKNEKPKPKPKPVKPKPIPKPIEKPVVKKSLEKPSERQKPLTKAQKQARKKAADSGLLALSSELSGLMDTSEVSREMGGAVVSHTGSAEVASQNTAVLTADVGKGSGGVNAAKYATTVARTKLSRQEIKEIRQSLVASNAQDKSSTRDRDGKSRSGNVRAEEDITIVFDQNKSVLYSIYNRERRMNPGLKGKLVLELTIAPSGKVTAIKVVSSELNAPTLEMRLISRIKLFNFGAQDVKPVTVTYPIEFLPS